MKKKRFLGILLSLALMLTMMPMLTLTAFAGTTFTDVKYLDENGKTQTCASATRVDSSIGTTWNGGWYYADISVTIDEEIKANGDIHLILGDNARLTVKGINAGNNNIYIYAQSKSFKMGKLITESGGIIAYNGTTINGGNITAKGSQFGIFGGYSSNGVTINGGIVTATGEQGICGFTVQINDGIVNASGTSDGIFGRYGVSIRNCVVQASGRYGIANYTRSITIDDSDVTAEGGDIGINSRTFVDITKSSVIASGKKQAIARTVRNSVAGSGWTMAGVKYSIDVDTIGQDLDKFTKVQFPAEPDSAPAPDSAPTPAPAPAVDSVTVESDIVNDNILNAAITQAGGHRDNVTTIVIGKNVKKIEKGAFKNYKNVKTLVVKSKKLKKSRIKNSLKGSKIKKVKVDVGKKKTDKKYVRKYKWIFTKKNVGRKVIVTL